MTSNQFINEQSKSKAKDAIAAKKALLFALTNPPKNEDKEAEEVGEEPTSPLLKGSKDAKPGAPLKVEKVKAGTPTEDVGEDYDEDEAEGEDDDQGEDGTNEEGHLDDIVEDDEEHVFDEQIDMDEEVKEYNQIEQIFKQNNIPFNEEKLKSAIIWNNRITTEKEKKVDYQVGRYP